MWPGPIFGRELMVAARRRRTYQFRVSVALLVLLTIGGNYAGWYLYNRGNFSIHEMGRFCRYTFGALVVVQVIVTAFLVPDLVARGIGQERERRTLEYLLATPLGAGEIVVGKMMAGLLQLVMGLAVVAPIMALMPSLGGIDPRLVGMTYAGLAAVATFTAGLSAWVAIGSRSSQEAVGRAVGLVAAWIFLPFILATFRGLLGGWFVRWVEPVNNWLIASSPLALLVFGFRTRSWSASEIAEALAWMIGLEVAAGLVLLAWAVVRLRAVSRRLVEVSGRPSGDRRRGWRRRPVGDDPVLWRELRARRGSRLTRIVGRIAFSTIVGLLGFATLKMGARALHEVIDYGYGTTGPDIQRIDFNFFIRTITIGASFINTLIVAGYAAESVATEKLRETWVSLISTPLEGREIVRPKLLGALWRARPVMAILLVLWLVGVAAGAVHPVGFVAAMASLAAALGFGAALGTYQSVRARDVNQASSWTLMPLVLLAASGLLFALSPVEYTSVLTGAGSWPFVTYLGLASYRDIDSLRSLGPSLGSSMHLRTDEGIGLIVLTYLIGTIGPALAGLFFYRAACNGFDERIGRPQRSTANPHPHHPTPLAKSL